MAERDLKPGEVRTAPDRQTTPDLVRVHHADLNRTIVVRRQQLAQMDPAWEVQEADDLKCRSLDQALEDAGLPKSGSADEKRARLAEHEATALAEAASGSTVDTAVITENTEE